MTGVAGLIVKVNVALPVPPALVALMVTVYVPDRRRCARDQARCRITVKPAGNPVAL